MLKIGIVGPPSSGKTTVAEGLSHHYKEKGIYKRVELIAEYAREFVIRFGATKPADQLHILQEQIKKEEAAEGADFMFTDSPFWLSYVYACHHGDWNDARDRHYIHAIHELILPRIHAYDLIFYLPTNEELRANANDGHRVHTTPQELWAVDKKIQGFMNLHDIKFEHLMEPPDKRVPIIYNSIERHKHMLYRKEQGLDKETDE